jgi:PAS domain S-box-containing protein
MSSPDSVLSNRLARLRESFGAGLSRELERINTGWSDAVSARGAVPDFTALSSLLERLVGSGLALGFPAIALGLQRLQSLVVALLQAAVVPTTGHVAQWELLYAELERVAAHRRHGGRPAGTHIDLTVRGSAFGGRVHLLAEDTLATRNLMTSLVKEGWQVSLLQDLGALERSRLERIPDAEVIDMDVLGTGYSTDVPALGQVVPLYVPLYVPVPRIFISSRDDTATRLRAVRAGGARFRRKPLTDAAILDNLIELVGDMPRDRYRIMIIHDDPVYARFLADILEHAGMSVTVVCSPVESLLAIHNLRPELILLDAEMQVCSGLELVALIGQEERFAGIALVLLMSQPGYGAIRADPGHAVDDIVSRPVSPASLVATIRARMARNRSSSKTGHELVMTMGALEQLRAAMDLHSAVCVTTAEGAIISVNEKFCAMSGYSRQELAGMDLHTLLVQDENDRLLGDIFAAVSEQRPWHGEVCLRGRGDNLYWAMQTLVPFIDNAGKIYQFVNLFNDITGKVLEGRQLQQTRDLAMQVSQAKSEFLTRISHELRTPLNAIMGFAQLLLDRTRRPEGGSTAKYAKEIHRAGQHLVDLINDLLDLSRIDVDRLRVEPITVPVAEIVRETRNLIAPLAAERKISLSVEHKQPDTLCVRADPVRLKQVLVNLLVNAVKYNRAGGAVHICSELRGTELVVIEIADNGPGIAQEDLPRLFQPFSRLAADQHVEGAGIGLALSKRLVELMQGGIEVESKSGQGTVFRVVLPKADHAAASAGLFARPGPARESGSVSGGGACRVLYIEDDPASLLVVQEFLARQRRYSLMHAADAETGLSLLQTEKPDLVLMDMQLAGASGFDALARLRALGAGFKNCPVIAVSALAAPEDRERAFAAGADAYVTKPIDLQVLLDVLEQYSGGDRFMPA